MQPSDYIRIAKRWVPVALVLATVAAVAAFALTRYAIRPVYTAAVTLEVQLGFDANNPSTDPIANQGQATTEAAVAMQSPYVDQAISMAANQVPKHDVDPAVNVDCEAKQGTSLFTCKIDDHNPVFAAAVANNLANVFIQAESRWQRSRYKAQLNRLHVQEAAALKAGDHVEYAALLQSETQVAVAEAQTASIVRVVTPAGTPITPSSPHPPLNAILAFFLIFCLVVGAGGVADRLDDSIRGEEELKSLTGLPIIGMIPSISALTGKKPTNQSLVVSNYRRSSVAEAFRVARTGLMFAGIENNWRTLLVASPIPGEGKSTVAVNVAAAFAETGKSVILVDLDLWHRSVSRVFDAPNYGLINLLLEEDRDLDEYLIPSPVPNLRILPGGPVPPNPAKLIGSRQMADVMDRLRSMADIIIIDSPALLAVADAAVAATLCDAAVLVVRPDKSKRRSLLRAIETLQSVGVQITGVIVNSFGSKKAYYYDYGAYGAYFGSEGEQTPSNNNKTSLAGSAGE